MAKFLSCAVVLVFAWSLKKVGCVTSSGASLQDNKPNCIPVTCQNGIGTLELSESMVEERRGCQHRLYNETGHFLGEADQSGLMNLSCQSHNYTRQVTWKILCDDKMMDEEVCFRIEGQAEGLYDDQRKSHLQEYILWIVILVVFVIIAVFIIGVLIRNQRNTFRVCGRRGRQDAFLPVEDGLPPAGMEGHEENL